MKNIIAETTEVEFKVSLEAEKPKNWLKTVCAFANESGGTIYFGIADNRDVIGIKDVQDTIEKISEIVKTKIEPMVRVSITVIEKDNKNIVKLEIHKGAVPPYYYVNEGTKTTFTRVGNESVTAPTNIINELVLKGQKLSFDALISNTKIDEVSFTLLKATYKQRALKTFNEEKDFISFELVDMENKNLLTYAGVLLSDQCPLRQSKVFCTRWNGIHKGSIKGDAIDTKEYGGSLISLLENSIIFVRNHSKLIWNKTPNGREEYPDYNEDAVFEVVNALMHRDYGIIGSEVHIDIYDDRLEIVSPRWNG
ncbi:MAG: putative DNA binding domain-containing protein [Clostridia bacterium]